MRYWKNWPKKFKDELNGVAGVTGIGGGLMSVAGVTVLAGNVGLAMTGIGGLVMLATFVYAGAKAIPEKLETPQSLVGSEIALSKLDNVFPSVKKLAVIGLNRSGKTTLKKSLAFEPRINEQTLSVTAQIVPIPNKPPDFLAILDAAGDRYQQQFDTAKEADFICIMLDHNFSDSDVTLSNQRLKDCEQLLQQLRNTLVDANIKRKSWIEILVNKSDLWERTTTVEKTKFQEFYTREFQKWESSNLAHKVTLVPHSNEKAVDVSRFMNIIKSSVKND